MSRFVVDFACSNDAFKPDPILEVVKCLRHIADRLEKGDACDTYRNVVDGNGNIVGTFKLIPTSNNA